MMLRAFNAAVSRPLTGARIETRPSYAGRPASYSPPHGGADRNTGTGVATHAEAGRPLTGARIETPRQLPLKRNFRSPPHGGADRNRDGPDAWPVSVVAPSRGRGSKHAFGGGIGPGAWSPPHGGADRNIMTDKFTLPNQCRPLTGARIETSSGSAPSGCGRVAPSRGRGSKLNVARRNGGYARSPPHGGADRNVSDSEPCAGMDVAPSRGRGLSIQTRRNLRLAATFRSGRPLRYADSLGCHLAVKAA